MDMEERIIDFVRDHPCLYDKRTTAYRNSMHKDKLWTELAQECNTEVTSCKTKWKSLRDRFVREFRKMNPPEGTIKPDPDSYSSWPFFDQLLFLKEVVSPHKPQNQKKQPNSRIQGFLDEFLFVESNPTHENGPSPEDDMEDTKFSLQLQQPEPGPSPMACKRKREDDEYSSKFSDFIERETRLITSAIKMPEARTDKHSAFLEMLRQKLNAFPDDTCEDLKVEILVWLHGKIKEHKAVINSFIKNSR